jgi:hypothetical protein
MLRIYPSDQACCKAIIASLFLGVVQSNIGADGTAWHMLRRLHIFCIKHHSFAIAGSYIFEKEASMKAVVMAGGEGSRLRPLTIRRPKPMVPIAGKPVMEHILHLLKRHGITDVIVTVQYLASNIEDYFGNGSQSLTRETTVPFRTSSPLSTFATRLGLL